jgi:hypothetical protein
MSKCSIRIKKQERLTDDDQGSKHSEDSKVHDAVLYDNPAPSALLLDGEQGCTYLFRWAQPD